MEGSSTDSRSGGIAFCFISLHAIQGFIFFLQCYIFLSKNGYETASSQRRELPFGSRACAAPDTTGSGSLAQIINPGLGGWRTRQAATRKSVNTRAGVCAGVAKELASKMHADPQLFPAD